MAEYVAFARIEGAGRVRLLGARLPFDGDALGAIEDLSATEASRLSPPIGHSVRERWQDAREQWAITTFYLFDPNSWR